MTYTAEEKLNEVLRELRQRSRVYQRAIDRGTMSSQAAARQIAIMEAIAADYEKIVAKDRLL